MTETVLVTGGSGYVGGWCIVELLRRGYAVRATVRSAAKEAGVRAAVASQVDPGERLAFAQADLMADAGWDAAVAGCDYVLHVASPLGAASGSEAALIAAAKEGTLRVLAAAVRAGVKRVVVTSSTAACSPDLQGPDTTDNAEVHWTDLEDRRAVNAYRRSKTLAERAAWDFMLLQTGTELVTVLPSAVFGPVLSREGLGSVQMISRMLEGKMPGIPRLGFSVVDVRDLAIAHVLAMTSPDAPGQRFIACGDFMWMADLARTLREALGARAAKVPTKPLPNFVMRFASIFDPALRAVTPNLGHAHAYTSAKAQRMLGWSPRPTAETVVDCAESLLAGGA